MLLNYNAPFIDNQEDIKHYFNKALAWNSWKITRCMRELYDTKMTSETKEIIDKKIITLTIFKQDKSLIEFILDKNKKVIPFYRNYIGFENR